MRGTGPTGLQQTVRVPAVLLLVIATALWGGNYIVGHYAVVTLSPLSLTWLRWAVALVPLVVIAQLVEAPNWLLVLRQWPRLLLMGVFGALGYPFLLYLALTHTSAVNASLINAANPALIVIFAALFLRRPAGRLGWTGIGLGLIGVLLILTDGHLGRLLALDLNTGDLIMLVAIVCWSAYAVLGTNLRLPLFAALAVQVALAVVVVTPFVLVWGLDVPQSAPVWWALLFIVAGPSLISYLCWNAAVPRVSSTTLGASMNLVTVFTVAAAALLGELPTAVQLVGGALVVGGVLLTLLQPRAARQPEPAGAGHGIFSG